MIFDSDENYEDDYWLGEELEREAEHEEGQAAAAAMEED